MFKTLLRLLVLVLLTASCGSEPSMEKPNVIIIITDDQGYGDLGCNGNTFIKTPHLDHFCDESVSFTDFHVSTTCAPTRGSLMTGRHTNRLNVFHTISGRSILFEDELTLPEVLARNGYVNGMFGKWHLGDNYPYRPEDRGFDEVVRHGGGGIGQMPDFWGNDYFDDHYWHNGEPEAYNGYCTDVFFKEAMRFITEHKDEPFFCYLSTNAPHGPLNVPKEYVDLYDGVDVPANVKRFYGMISNIDDNFDELEDLLEDLGIEDNTVLIFMTDNGTAYGRKIYNAGMRGQKGSEYDGGHRVPFMIRYPDGGIGGGIKIEQLTAHYDILPTLVDLLDLDFEEKKPMDGKSLKPLLEGDTAGWPNRILYMDTQRLQNLVKGKQYSVMEEDWRLVNGAELYRIKEDPGQETNVIDAHPDVVERLAQGYEDWWSSIMSEGPNLRFAYIQAGSEDENPLRLCSHDLHTGNLGRAWHQYGAAQAVEGSGTWKLEILEDGKYSFKLRRFPPESGLAINAEFAAVEKPFELEQTMPETRNPGFEKAYLFLADFRKTVEIKDEAEEVEFTMELAGGKYDMEALLIDQVGKTYPAYFVIIEKL